MNLKSSSFHKKLNGFLKIKNDGLYVATHSYALYRISKNLNILKTKRYKVTSRQKG